MDRPILRVWVSSRGKPVAHVQLCMHTRTRALDLMCLDYDGNVADAALLALTAALEDLTLPQTTSNESGRVLIAGKPRARARVHCAALHFTSLLRCAALRCGGLCAVLCCAAVHLCVCRRAQLRSLRSVEGRMGRQSYRKEPMKHVRD